MPTPCKLCRDRSLECLVDVSSGRCQNCVAAHKTCDLRVTLSEFNKLSAAKERFQRQLREAEEHLEEVEERALEEIRTARAKVRRLRKQLHRADDKEREAIQNESERIAEAEAEEAPSLLSLPDLSFPGSEILSLPPEAWDTSVPSYLSWDTYLATPDPEKYVPWFCRSPFRRFFRCPCTDLFLPRSSNQETAVR